MLVPINVSFWGVFSTTTVNSKHYSLLEIGKEKEKHNNTSEELGEHVLGGKLQILFLGRFITNSSPILVQQTSIIDCCWPRVRVLALGPQAAGLLDSP